MSGNPGAGQGRHRRPRKLWPLAPNLNRLTLSDDEFTDAQETFSTPVATEDLLNSVTFIDDVISSPDASADGDISSAPSNGTASFSSGRPPLRHHNLQLTSLFGSADDSSSEEENSAKSPQYFNWGSPPPLDAFSEPSSAETSDGVQAVNRVHRGVVRELDSEKEDSPPTSKVDSAKKLKSTPEKRRLQLYLARIQEEGRRAQEKPKEKPSTFVSGPSFSLTPPETTEEEEEEKPQHFDLSDLDLEGEELVFSPIFDGWGSQPNSRDPPVARNFPKRLRAPGETPLASSSAAGASQRASAALPIEQAVLARQTNRRPRLMRTLSMNRKQPPIAGAYTGAVRAASVQRGLQAGFDEGTSRRVTDLVVLGRAPQALELVAAACTEHLAMEVFMRKSGDKLRVEGRGSDRLRASLRFAEVEGVDPPRTLVLVRASRRDRGADAGVRVGRFFEELATQLDIDGRLPTDAGSIAAGGGRPVVRGRLRGRMGRGR